MLDAIKRVPGANQSVDLRLARLRDAPVAASPTAWRSSASRRPTSEAVAAQNQQFAAGRIGAPPTAAPVQQTIPVATSGRMTEPAQFDEHHPARAAGHAAPSCASRTSAAPSSARKDYSIRAKYNGKTATLIAIYQQPGANALQVAKDVRKRAGAS